LVIRENGLIQEIKLLRLEIKGLKELQKSSNHISAMGAEEQRKNRKINQQKLNIKYIEMKMEK